MRRLGLLLGILPLIATGFSSAQVDARMLRTPDVSATRIAFAYAGDIWVVPRAGGTAQRLSTPRGQELFPRFSPDGERIAYSANYDGNTDVYVIAAGGGLPTRVTHHPAPDRILGWFPDGKSLLFATPMTSGKQRFSQLYRVPVDGGLPERLPVPYGEFGAISPDGKLLAYMPISNEFRTWKRYRGGMASRIWIFDLEKKTAEPLKSEANDAHPMWHGRTLYFVSDRGPFQRANIWAYDIDAKTYRQVTKYTDDDVRFPSIGRSEIVFEYGDRLYLLDLQSEQAREVPVTVVTDRATLKPRAVNVSKLIRNATISPSGKRAVLQARGDLFSVPAEHGIVLDVTRTSGVAERYPAWSPDGKTLAYFSDRSGEYELTVRPADGTGVERTVTKLGPGFRYRIFWSPDSRKVAFVDQAMKFRLCDVATGQVTVIDTGLYLFDGDLDGQTFSWSADSRWLAYGRQLENRSAALFLYDTREAKLHQATSGFYNVDRPVFDPDGKYLYVLTSRTFKPIYGDLDQTWIYANTTNIAAIALRRDVTSPIGPRNDDDAAGEKAEKKDDDKAGAAKKPEAKAGDKKTVDLGDKPEKKPAPKAVDIDLDGLEQRLVLLPPAGGNYNDLLAAPGKILYRRLARTGAPEDDKSTLCYWDLEEREEKTILSDVSGVQLSADHKKLLVQRDDAWAIIDLKADAKMDKKLDVAGLEMTVDPVAEWHQIFSDAWRLERDYFYDPNMHGVDWKAMREHYGKMLDDAVTRWDVNFVLGELIGELNSSHTYRGGGDIEDAPQRGVGLLGVDYALENGAYRIKKILRGAPWDNDVRSPLDQPGVNVKEGEYLLAVNRTPLDLKTDPWAAFEGLAGKTVLLTVNSKPSLEGAREVLVETLSDEATLRNRAWIDSNRQAVERLTQGRAGYVYVPDTGRNGQTELVRQFTGQYHKEALVIDERFNDGGQIPDRFVELLSRPLMSFWGVRDGRDWQWPVVGHYGPQVMLINGWSGSGGDAFPLFFKKAGRGPLIGTRTWGGLIGISGNPELIDGGAVTVPTFGIYSTDGQWIVEGHGVDPDIEVVDDPSQMMDGADPQLARAAQEINRLLSDKPFHRPDKPKYPNKAGRP